MTASAMKMAAPMEVGLCCADAARLKRFYLDVLGCAEISTIEVPPDKAAATGLTDGGYTVVRVQTPWGERIKLLQPVRAAAARPADRGILDRNGASYLTFIVDDLEAMLEQLRRHRVELLSGPRKVEVRPGVFLVFARDPEGNILEFVQYSDLKSYRPDLPG